MIMTKKTKVRTYKITLTSLIVITLTAFELSPTYAQDSRLVISSKTAEVVKSDVDYDGQALVFKPKTRLSDFKKANTPSFEKIGQAYSDTGSPALEISSNETARLSLGILSSGADTADELTRRDPYSIENVEVDPIYPEGIYVDEMRATAGLKLLSDF